MQVRSPLRNLRNAGKVNSNCSICFVLRSGNATINGVEKLNLLKEFMITQYNKTNYSFKIKKCDKLECNLCGHHNESNRFSISVKDREVVH